MCISNLFGNSDALAAQQLQIAQQQQQQAQASIAAANLDTEQSRTAAEATMRKAAASQGFSSTIFGGATQQQSAPVAYKALFGS